LSKNYKILIVDDSKSIRALLSSLIEENVKHVQVDTVSSAEEALEYLERHTVNLILLDIIMPGIDGFEFAKLIKQNESTQKIPIIFITASLNKDEFMQKGFSLGAIDYIQKPFDEIHLANKINTYVKLFKKEDELEESFSIIYNILAHMDNFLLIIKNNKAIQTNKRLLDFFGYNSLEDFKSNCISDFFIKDDTSFYHGSTIKDLIQALKQNTNIDTKVKMYDKNENCEKIFITKISLLNSETEKSEEYIISFTDITETEKLKDSYQRLASIDTLTQIANRKRFNEELHKELQKYKIYKKPLSLLMFDIDHFKKVNDDYGHQVGDDILIELSSLVQGLVREIDLFARWGGEEFFVILPNTTIEDSNIVAKNLREAIENHKFSGKINVTCSFGISSVNEADDEDSLLKRIDKALYKAKANGRNRVETL